MSQQLSICSSRWPRFSSSNSHGELQPPIIPRDLMFSSSLWEHQVHMWWTGIYIGNARRHTCTHTHTHQRKSKSSGEINTGLPWPPGVRLLTPPSRSLACQGRSPLLRLWWVRNESIWTHTTGVKTPRLSKWPDSRLETRGQGQWPPEQGFLQSHCVYEDRKLLAWRLSASTSGFYI